MDEAQKLDLILRNYFAVSGTGAETIMFANTDTLEKQEVAQHFSAAASTYNEKNYRLAGKRGKYPDIFRRHHYILEMLNGAAGKALEIGCGSGEMLYELLKKNFKVVGIDIAIGMLRASRTLLSERLPDKRAGLLQADIEHLSFPNETFDVVIAAGVIEYLSSDEKLLPELHRVLKPGGILIVSVRNKANLSRTLTTTRDLLQALPVLGVIFKKASLILRRLLALTPNGGIPARRHLPGQLKRHLRRCGFIPQDEAFYHFTVFPRFLERRIPDFCVRWEEKFEKFSRTPVLRYFANQYLVKAQKVF
jgi:ubiquinone/menaquinone biosynthesis C-methylase UbiE